MQKNFDHRTLRIPGLLAQNDDVSQQFASKPIHRFMQELPVDFVYSLVLMDSLTNNPPFTKIVKEYTGEFNHKYVVCLSDGSEVESVLYRKQTLCLSTQVGCAIRCPFCASGQFGLARQLTIAELIDQVLLVKEKGHSLTRLTLSGVGEPLHNFNVVRAFFSWAEKQHLPTSLTTSGGTSERLREALIEWPHNGLTISVHAGSEEVRKAMVPHGLKLEEIYAVLSETTPKFTKRLRKKTALAYLLVRGMNDSESEIRLFAKEVRRFALPIHLYALNQVESLGFEPVSEEQYRAAYAYLSAEGLMVRMSSKARVESNGGCGTLVAIRKNKKDALPSGQDI